MNVSQSGVKVFAVTARHRNIKITVSDKNINHNYEKEKRLTCATVKVLNNYKLHKVSL